MTTGIIFDIKKFSLHDGPGIWTTVFLKGCPLTCWWCHNPESQSTRPEFMFRGHLCQRCGACVAACQQQAITLFNGGPVTDGERCILCGRCAEACYAEARQQVGREMSVAEVMAEIEQDLSFYDESGGGVTFSGGEPLVQADFLLELLVACRAKEIHTTLDTCGLADWPRFERLRPYVNLFLYDLKLMDSARHRHFTGGPNELILANLRALARLGHSVIVRIPLIPGINDDPENLRQAGVFVAGELHLGRVDLLPYHAIARDKYTRLNKDYALPDTAPPSAERMAELAAILQDFGLEVTLGG